MTDSKTFAALLVGQPFNEVIFTDRDYVEQVFDLLPKAKFHPLKAAKLLNSKLGDIVAEYHEGTLIEYEDVEAERRIPMRIRGIGVHEFFFTIIRVRYEDGFAGYSYRMRTQI